METKYGINTGVIFISHEDLEGGLTDVLTDIVEMATGFFGCEAGNKWDFCEYESETTIASSGECSAKLYRMLQREFPFVKMEYALYENGFKEVYPICTEENDRPAFIGESGQLMQPWEYEVIIRALQRAWQKAEAV